MDSNWCEEFKLQLLKHTKTQIIQIYKEKVYKFYLIAMRYILKDLQKFICFVNELYFRKLVFNRVEYREPNQIYEHSQKVHCQGAFMWIEKRCIELAEHQKGESKKEKSLQANQRIEQEEIKF